MCVRQQAAGSRQYEDESSDGPTVKPCREALHRVFPYRAKGASPFRNSLLLQPEKSPCTRCAHSPGRTSRLSLVHILSGRRTSESPCSIKMNSRWLASTRGAYPLYSSPRRPKRSRAGRGSSCSERVAEASGQRSSECSARRLKSRRHAIHDLSPMGQFADLARRGGHRTHSPECSAARVGKPAN